MTDTTILTNEQIIHKTRRIAYQILESNSQETEVILAGISGNGYVLATRLKEVLQNISDLQIVLCEVNKIETSIEASEYQNKSIVLVDDVLSSGTTLIYGVKHFLEVPLKRFKTAVLLNRNHKKFPVKADFKGLSLSTSLKEHVEVKFTESNAIAFLS
jgi:pyrimidine operon attenuation protein/uracil phosphoribosyltransferase